jgi:hypothetical protein
LPWTSDALSANCDPYWENASGSYLCHHRFTSFRNINMMKDKRTPTRIAYTTLQSCLVSFELSNSSLTCRYSCLPKDFLLNFFSTCCCPTSPMRVAISGFRNSSPIAEAKAWRTVSDETEMTRQGQTTTRLGTCFAGKASDPVDDALYWTTTLTGQHGLPSCHCFKRYNTKMFIFWCIENAEAIWQQLSLLFCAHAW